MRTLHLLLPFLLLPLLAHAQDVVAQDEVDDAEDDSDIDDDDGSLRGLGKRCGRNHPCMEGLDCYPAPVLKKCFPVSCAVQAVVSAMNETTFDLKTYGNDMMARAGVGKESKFFRRFPDKQMNAVDTNSTEMHRLLDEIKNNPPPIDRISESFRSCTKASVEGFTPYYGASWGLGLLGTYNGDVYWVSTTCFRLFA